MTRQLSQTPSAIRQRERKLDKFCAKIEREMNAEVKKHMDAGLSFDDAWIASGGMIVPLEI